MRPSFTPIAEKVVDSKRTGTLDVTVLAGGPGVEREVSLESGRLVRDALLRLEHRVTMLDIRPDDLSALDVPADVIFIALHGAFGEDGALQRILDERGLAYTGSGAAASAMAMDKVHTKARLIEHGIPTPRFDVIKAARIRAALGKFVPPVVVKPRNSGSSVDTYIARERDSFESALDTVVARYGAALVEEYVEGPELTVGILEDRALPVCEIRTKREFYDYEAKYLDDETEYVFEIELPEQVLTQVQRWSEQGHTAIGCRDFSRVDWMVDRKTLQPYAIEVNTIPGLTSHSLLPKAAAREGITYEAMCQDILELATIRATHR